MTKQALRELRDKVAAGEHWHFSQFEPPELPLTWIDAFNGSLDAAVDFLEAVLPGSDWVVRTCDPNEPDAAYAHTWLGDHPSISGVHHEYWADTPARALLLATLDALIARAE